ncbi:MAG TPA: SRPBCC family protein [Woeseiaceae bacterium]
MNQQARADHQESPVDTYGVMIATDTLRIERLLPGPIERVWSYLTESDKRARWLAAGDMDLQVGGIVEHVFRNWELTENDDPPPAKYAEHTGESRMQGRITACEPPYSLAYTWSESAGEYSEVAFELSERGTEVMLVLTHRRLVNREELLGVSAGWHTHLDILVDRLSGRTSPGFWRTHTRLEAEYVRRIG